MAICPTLLSSSHWRRPMKRAPAIDTLRYAQRLADTGMNRETANAMAQALNEELEDRLLTKADLTQALEPIKADLTQALAPILAKLGEVDQRFASMDGKFASMDGKFEAMDGKFEAMDAKIEAMDAKFEAKIDSLSTKLSFAISTMMLIVSLLVAMGTVGAIQIARSASPDSPPAAAVELPAGVARKINAVRVPRRPAVAVLGTASGRYPPLRHPLGVRPRSA